MITREFCETDEQRICKFKPECFWAPCVSVMQSKNYDRSKWRSPSLGSSMYLDLKPGTTASDAALAVAEAMHEAAALAAEWEAELAEVAVAV